MQRKAIAEYDERKRREAEARRLRYVEQRKKASSKASKSQNTTDTGAFSRLAALSPNLSLLTSAPSRRISSISADSDEERLLCENRGRAPRQEPWQGELSRLRSGVL